jgi:uncharacterized membrane protein
MTIDKARRRQLIARWHRRFAVFIAIWLVLLALSGVLINHANDWGLDRASAPAFVQRMFYGIEVADLGFCGGLDSDVIDCQAVFAYLPLPAGRLLLAENQVYLLDEAGRLVEKLAASHLGLDRLEAGLQEGERIYLRGSATVVVTDPDLLEQTVLDSNAAEGLAEREWLVRQGSAAGISWERLLLDLHAARFLGPLAVAFSDLMAALILMLAVSGTWLYRLKRAGNGNGSSRNN